MSEQFQVTARKWRPLRFDEVVGQEHVTQTLKNAIREERLAHAYLFTGQRGCGKTTVARILAKAINCPNASTNGFEPCNVCENCVAITEGRSMDVSEIDGASNRKIEDIRELRDNVRYPPLTGKYKVVIIDEVHQLTTEAFNALLKTLEEPPKHLIFVFATTEAQKVLGTILSRTQRYDFRRIQIEEIVAQLRKISDAESLEIDDDALHIIARKADGSMRDAQSIFDQLIAYCGTTVETSQVRDALNLIDLEFFFEVSDAIAAREPSRAFTLSQELLERGYDVEEFFVGLLEHFRCLLTARVLGHGDALEVASAHQVRYVRDAKQFAEADLIRLVRLGQDAVERLRYQQPRIVLEVALVEMMMLARALEVNELLQAIKGGNWQNQAVGTAPSAPPTSIPSTPSAPLAPTMVAPTRPAPRAAATDSRRESTSRVQSAAAPLPPSPAAAEESLLVEEPSVPAAVDNETVAARWAEFGELLKTKSRGLHSIFPELEFCGVRRSVVCVGVNDRTMQELVQKYRTEFEEGLRQLFAPGLRVEVGSVEAMHKKAGTPIVTIAKADAPTINTAHTRERSPIEDALISTMGATPM